MIVEQELEPHEESRCGAPTGQAIEANQVCASREDHAVEDPQTRLETKRNFARAGRRLKLVRGVCAQTELIGDEVRQARTDLPVKVPVNL